MKNVFTTFSGRVFRFCLLALLLSGLLPGQVQAQAPGNALAFDGVNDYVQTSPTPAPQLGTGNLTLEAWVRTTSTGQKICIGADGGAGDYWLGIQNTKAAFTVNGSVGTCYSTTSINDGKWHHIAGVRTGAQTTIYVDGQAENTFTIGAATVGNPTGYLAVGRYGVVSNAYYWNGSIDEARFYNVALTPAQVRADMFSTTAAVPGNLLYYYNFDQGTAGGNNAGVTTLTDQSGNGHTGTLMNFALTGTSSNWVESYAMVVPTATAATGTTGNGFTATWTAPAVGTVTNYLLDVATNATFTALVTGSPFTVAAPATSKTLSGLTASTTYYYRVRADKTSVTGQGAYSNTMSVTTLSLLISSTSPTANAKAAPASGPVAITFNQAVTSGSTAALKVFSAQRGGLRSIASGTTSVGGSTLSFAPTYAFKAGETVQATVTTAATASAGGSLATARVLQFTAATAGGTGTLAPGTNVAAGGLVNTIAVGDVDNDGDLDMLTTNGGGSSVSIRLNNGSGGYGSASTVAVGAGPSTPALADVDGDGDLDLLTPNNGAGTVSVRFNNGSGGFSGSTNVGVGSGPTHVTTGDVDGDGDLDILSANYSAGTVSVRFNDGSGGFTGSANVGVAGNPGNSVLADVDGDGDLDMVASNNTGSTVSVRVNDGSGNFSGSTAVAVAAGAGSVALGDVNGDGSLDILATSNGTNAVSVRLNDGSGSFSGSTAVATGNGPGSVSAVDMDGDGDLDIVCSNYSSSTVSVRFNNGSGTFSGGTDSAVDTNPNSMALGDVDGDGDVDALTANYTAGTVSVRLNQAPGPLTVSIGTLGSPKAIPAGTYTTITITGTGVAQLTGSTTATTAVQVNGTLLTACQALSGAGSFTLAAGATLGICDAAGIAASGSTGAVQVTGSRSFATDASYLYNGTVAQATGAGLPAAVRNLTTTNAQPVTLTQPVTVAEVLTVAGSGNFLLNGQALTLTSTATGTALMVNSNTGVVSGSTATMQRHLETNTGANGYRHYASPMTSETVNTLATAGYTPDFSGAAAYNTSATPGLVSPFPTVFGYNQDRIATTISNYTALDKGWQAALSGQAMPSGKGYSVQAPGAALVDFTGTLTTGPVTQSALSRGTNSNAGWHLLGNPYAAPLDWNTMSIGNTAANNLQNMDGALYVYQSSGPSTGTYRTYLASVPGSISPLVNAGSGFFVHTTVAGTPGTVRFTNANRVTSFGPQPAFGRSNDLRPVVGLTLAGTAGTDALTLYADPAASAGVDAAFDAVKLANINGLNLAAVGPNGTLLAIDGLPAFTAQRIALQVRVPANGTYTLSAATLANLPATTAVVLVDALTGHSTDLRRTASYSFTAVATAPVVGRFFLNVTPAGTALATAAESLSQSLTLYPNPARSAVAVVGASAGASVQVFDALGRVIVHATADASGTAQLALPAGLAAGLYVVKSGSQLQRLTVE